MAKKGNQIGGRRPGAGRPLSAATIKSRELVHKYTRDGGILPFDALMANMRYYYEEAKTATPLYHAERARFEKKWGKLRWSQMTKAQRDEYVEDKDRVRDARSRCNGARINLKENAVEAAPYIHPRLQNITADVSAGGGNIIIRMDDVDSRA